jgi:hypothetical protein
MRGIELIKLQPERLGILGKQLGQALIHHPIEQEIAMAQQQEQHEQEEHKNK